MLDSFFRNNRALPLSLLYKRQVKPAQALRARAEFLYNFFQTSSTPLREREVSGEAFRQIEYRVEFAVGKEYAVAFILDAK